MNLQNGVKTFGFDIIEKKLQNGSSVSDVQQACF